MQQFSSELPFRIHDWLIISLKDLVLWSENDQLFCCLDIVEVEAFDMVPHRVGVKYSWPSTQVHQVQVLVKYSFLKKST